ncbi:DUF2235 domain-containing protein [Mangrovicoccus algicola]|uniref:DUF2235 domain-containing protein n=1 Tax=Mangrovicoccus algicola TaxID=2771008 RepID=A0A8J6Z0U7_9RHOB|nr:DUF2235 domain-containing protein [Mangrovicoccus algicola]MBE3639548.1 DUF2235 domain-containing protein [Mangrovicoccus algicola]
MVSCRDLPLRFCHPSLSRVLRQRRRAAASLPGRGGRGAQDLVVILDGTLSTLHPDRVTNAGQIYTLLSDLPWKERPRLYYEAGIQWGSWRETWQVIAGVGINRQIQRAYGWLASRYRPGDRIFLLGYSRGAFAVRSLAGVIDRLGLLKARAATERNIRDLYRHYREESQSVAARRFARRFCHAATPVEMVGVFDTVKALGLRLPLLWRLTEPRHAFHSPQLSHNVAHGYQALALNETRDAFAPLLWSEPEGWQGRVEQVWFRGTHGDIGGQLSGRDAARPLSNIPLVWMLEKLEARGIALPPDWRDRFPCDPAAPSIGAWRGWGRLFLMRHRRAVGQGSGERLHETARHVAPGWRLPLPGRFRPGGGETA